MEYMNAGDMSELRACVDEVPEPLLGCVALAVCLLPSHSAFLWLKWGVGGARDDLPQEYRCDASR